MKYVISWLRLLQRNKRRRLPRSPASMKGKNKTYKKIKSSACAENGMQTSWSKIKLTITKSGASVQIRVLTDTQRRGLLFCCFVLFSNSLLKFGDNIHVFLINYFYRLLRQSHKQIKFASSTFMWLVLHTLPRRTGFHRIFAPVRRATPSISLLAIKANGQTTS